MIELTEQQLRALQNPEVTPPRLVNARTKETYVLLHADEYERLKENEYDDSPWTREELQALAGATGKTGKHPEGVQLHSLGSPSLRGAP